MNTTGRLTAALAAAAALLPSLAGTAAAQGALPAKDRTALTKVVKKGMSAERLPGLNVGVWVPGRGRWVESFGVANRRTGERMRRSQRVRIASITKTFTATAVLQLVDAGRLRLDDTVAEFVAGVPNGDRITVRQLLGMTSGVYDYTMDKRFGRRFAANPLMPFGPRDVLAIVRRHEPEFAPGADLQYADTNYTLLGMIVEKVTGRPVGKLIERRILEPLRLRHTSYPGGPRMPAPFAHGYYAGDKGTGRLRDYTRINPDVAGAAGAMISTLGDLRTWAKALADGTLLAPATQTERLQFGAFPNPGLSVGYGLGIFNLAGFIGHNGAIYGYSTAMFHLPEANATIVLAGNKATNFSQETTDMFVQIAQYLFPERFAS